MKGKAHGPDEMLNSMTRNMLRLLRNRALHGVLACASAFLPAAAQSHPDLTGMWQFEFSGWNPAASPHAPVLKPAAQAIFDKRRASSKTGYVRSVQNILCLPTAFPVLMMWRSPIEIMSAPGRLSIITEHDPGNDEPRTIYLTEKTHPADIDETWNGHSIAHWEGPVLVVDTIGFNDRGELFEGVPRTETTHIVERFRLTGDGKSLIDQMTIDDPATFVSPWRFEMKFDRLPPDTERLEAVCEPDLDALKALDLNSVKDIDPEAARLLDPSRHYNAFGNQFLKETK